MMGKSKAKAKNKRSTVLDNPLPMTAGGADAVKIISVPAFFGKRMGIADEPAGTHQLLLRVCGRLRRYGVVGGTRGFGVRLYGDFIAQVYGDEGEPCRVVSSRIAFLPDPVSRDAVAAYRGNRQRIEESEGEFIELDCDVWAVADPTEAAGYRLVAVGTLELPDRMADLFRRSNARATITPGASASA